MSRRYDVYSGRWVNRQTLDDRIRRMVTRVSRDQKISGADAVELARKVAFKWASDRAHAHRAWLSSGFKYVQARAFGVKNGKWLGMSIYPNGDPYSEAHEEALEQGVQFIRDYKKTQFEYLLKDIARLEKFMRNLRDMDRQLMKKAKHETSTKS